MGNEQEALEQAQRVLDDARVNLCAVALRLAELSEERTSLVSAGELRQLQVAARAHRAAALAYEAAWSRLRAADAAVAQ